ncbi:hypothetical protein niasHT_031434 [Heterodera trifolii]|uniref:Serpin domain-containing protein n=1 Tax=Heterodera trifolii TaxID=157864 RepID=A0ABD2HR37_9BILA
MNGWVLIGDFVEFVLRPMCQTLKVNDGIGTEQLLPFEATVELPKFTLEATHELNKPLTNMGMATAFTDSANFEGISDKKPLLISKVVQKALIEVNEEGTVAAAATNVRIASQSSKERRQNLRFVADHPFCAFLIRDDSVLFSAIFRK